MDQLLKEPKGAQPTTRHTAHKAPEDTEHAHHIEADAEMACIQGWPQGGHKVLQ